MMTDRQTHRKTDTNTDRQTDRNTDRQTDRQEHKQTVIRQALVEIDRVTDTEKYIE